MDFKSVTEYLLSAFEAKGVRYALIGGFAMGAWGIARSTVDLDFLIHKDDLQNVNTILTNMGYGCRYRSENVSQFISPQKTFGEIDIIHAFREISVNMLERSENRNIFNETMTIKVLKVEDLIGLKVQAMANDPSRKSIDLADIESLMETYGGSIDWPLVKEYFDLFKFNHLFGELHSKHGKTE